MSVYSPSTSHPNSRSASPFRAVFQSTCNLTQVFCAPSQLIAARPDSPVQEPTDKTSPIGSSIFKNLRETQQGSFTNQAGTTVLQVMNGRTGSAIKQLQLAPVAPHIDPPKTKKLSPRTLAKIDHYKRQLVKLKLKEDQLFKAAMMDKKNAEKKINQSIKVHMKAKKYQAKISELSAAIQSTEIEISKVNVAITKLRNQILEIEEKKSPNFILLGTQQQEIALRREEIDQYTLLIQLTQTFVLSRTPFDQSIGTLMLDSDINFLETTREILQEDLEKVMPKSMLAISLKHY